MDFMSTVKGSMLENYYPKGWDMGKIDKCCQNPPESVGERQSFWNKDFAPIMCETLADFNVMLGHEIAMEIKTTGEKGQELALILPVGPMGMYKWIIYYLKAWNVSCGHVSCFNMDEWSDHDGNTLAASNTASFQYAMESNFYDPLGALTVPPANRNFATKDNLPTYHDKISAIKARGGRLVTVYGIGRACHIAFWEPHFAEEYATDEQWLKECYRVGAKLHPMTIEQNALTSFKSRTTLVSCTANTVGPGLFFQSDRMIGGADGTFSRGMQWQGMSFWMTLRYGPTRWITSTYIPTIPGTLFFLKELAGPLDPDCN